MDHFGPKMAHPHKGASTKNSCHAQRILAIKGVGGRVGGLKKSVKKGNLWRKYFFRYFSMKF